VVKKVSTIENDSNLQEYARKHGLQILKVTWEDTGRSKNSCWGPNISDMTLRLDKYSELLPVIRFPNFEDKTADLSMEQFSVSVGNEKGSTIEKIPLKKYLESPNSYIKSDVELPSLLCEERDKNILVSAQFCILPLSDGTCEFNVHLYNYQSFDTPKVLVLVVSQQGTSAQVLTGNPLYFNDNGKACNFIAERMKDVRKREGRSEAAEMSADEQEKNCLYIYQIPLKTKEPEYVNSPTSDLCYDYDCDLKNSNCVMECESECLSSERGMDDAILQKGEGHSDFKGTNNKLLERDPKFPIRCTLQFYKVTDSKVIPEAVFQSMADKINNVYEKGINQGSLVTDGFTGRSTEWVDKP